MIPQDSTVGADDERTLHRLEAFSDIVIGFCIAEMGLNLLVPQHASDLRTLRTGVTGFAISFVLISIVWWVHQRIFRTFFVLTRATLLLNFTLLGSLVLMVYLQQIAVHFILTDPVNSGYPVRLWMVSYVAVYGLLDAMLWIGLGARWMTLTDVDLRWGVHRALILLAGAGVFALSAAFYQYLHGSTIVIMGVTVIVTVRVLVSQLVKRISARRLSKVTELPQGRNS
jgi:uncharacterized membrane protein